MGTPRVPKRNKATPAAWQRQVKLCAHTMTKCRLHAQTPICNKSNADDRGLLDSAYRCIVHAQRLLRSVDKTKKLLESASCAKQRQSIMSKGMLRADRVIPNLRTLETTLLTRFASETVLVGPYRQFKAEEKTMECEFTTVNWQDSARMTKCRCPGAHPCCILLWYRPIAACACYPGYRLIAACTASC